MIEKTGIIGGPDLPEQAEKTREREREREMIHLSTPSSPDIIQLSAQLCKSLDD